MKLQKSKIILMVFFMGINTMCYCQEIRGIVIGDKTSLPLAYVHVGIIGKNLGTISNEDGTFSINIEKTDSRDVLAFSIIGYDEVRIPLNETNSDDYLEIRLKEKDYQLKGVVIEGRRLKKKTDKLKKIGAKIHASSQTCGVTGWGNEVGIRIKNDGNIYKIKSVNLRLHEVSYDSILFRINVYTIKNNLPDLSILTKEIFVKAYRGDTWILKDISKESIFFEENVIVAMEAVKGWSTRNVGRSVCYKIRRLYDSDVYIKRSSMDNWRTAEYPKITLNLDVEKYKKMK